MKPWGRRWADKQLVVAFLGGLALIASAFVSMCGLQIMEPGVVWGWFGGR